MQELYVITHVVILLMFNIGLIALWVWYLSELDNLSAEGSISFGIIFTIAIVVVIALDLHLLSRFPDYYKPTKKIEQNVKTK